MERGTTHRTTVDIEVDPFEQAKTELGTSGIRDTVNAALRRVAREAALRRGADRILGGEHNVATPEDLEELRRPRG